MRARRSWLPCLFAAGAAVGAAGAGGARIGAAAPSAGPEALVPYADSFVSFHGSDSVRARGKSKGQVLDDAATYRGRRVSGWLTVTESDTLRRMTFETEMPDSAFEAAAQMPLLSVMDWDVGMTRTLYEFDFSHARTHSAVLSDVAEERVTVPAGTFDTYRAILTQARTYDFLWFTRSFPHRPVKVFDPANQWTSEMMSQKI